MQINLELKVRFRYLKRKIFFLLNLKKFFQKSYYEKFKSYPKTLLITRQDNLGDALISLPFFESLRKNFDITILSSSYNNFIISPFFRTFIFDDHLKNNFSKDSYKNLGSYDVFIELIGKSKILKIAKYLKDKYNLYRYIIGFKLPISAFLADYAYPFSFSYNHQNILETYYKECEKALGVSLERKDSFDFSKLKKEYGINRDLNKLSKNKLLFFIGVKKFRNLDSKLWEKFFSYFIKNKISFGIIDSKVDKVFDTFSKEFKALKDKAYFYYSIKSLDDLFKTYFSIKEAKLLVGIDSGPMHLFSYGINTLTIFTVAANFNIWPPYTKKPYKDLYINEKINKEFLIKFSQKQDKSKKFILAKNLICQKLDTCVNCKETYCKNLNSKYLFEVVNHLLKNLK